MTARVSGPQLFPAVRDYIEGADLSALLHIQNLVQARLASFHPQQAPSPNALAARVKGLTEIVEVYDEGWGRRIDLY